MKGMGREMTTERTTQKVVDVQPERKMTFLDDIHIKNVDYVECIHTHNRRLTSLIIKFRGDTAENEGTEPTLEPRSINDKFRGVHNDMQYELKNQSELISELEDWI